MENCSQCATHMYHDLSYLYIHTHHTCENLYRCGSNPADADMNSDRKLSFSSHRALWKKIAYESRRAVWYFHIHNHLADVTRCMVQFTLRREFLFVGKTSPGLLFVSSPIFFFFFAKEMFTVKLGIRSLKNVPQLFAINFLKIKLSK